MWVGSEGQPKSRLFETSEHRRVASPRFTEHVRHPMALVQDRWLPLARKRALCERRGNMKRLVVYLHGG